MNYKPAIGLEIHTELKTQTKMFCDSLNNSDEKHPNVNICPICTGQPGTLPVINKEAVKKTILAGLALNCAIVKNSFFERKNYFYPDLPKGYQISQYQKPLCQNGYLNIKSKTSDPKRIHIRRIHLEEDTGKLVHPQGADYSLVDFNRAGIPLMELVTEPDMESGLEVKKFAEELQLIFRYLDISDADMEKGQMRVEVNISVSPSASSERAPSSLGTKVEIKNLNSIKAAADSVDYEIKRQTELLGQGKEIIQETRGWDENKQRTFSQRIKEGAQDYRYFPEPDLPPLKFSDKEIESIGSAIPELPEQKRKRFRSEFGLPEGDIEIFIKNKKLGDFFEKIVSELKSWEKLEHIKHPGEEHAQKLIKLSANYLITELQKLFGEVGVEIDSLKIAPYHFGEFITRIFHQEISSTGAQKLLKEMFETGKRPGQIIEELGIGQVSDLAEIEKVVKEVIAENPKPTEDYKKGRRESLQFLIGQIMKKTKGRANPEVARQLLEKELTK